MEKYIERLEFLNKVLIDFKKTNGIVIHQGWGANKQKITNLNKYLNKKIKGQKEVITGVCNEISNLVDDNGDISKLMSLTTNKTLYKKPIVIFLPGSSGVGKTYLVKVMADYLFDGDLSNLITLNSGEFSGELNGKNKILGAGPGYVGYGVESDFVTKLYQSNKRIVLIDEVEKISKDVVGIFLNAFDTGEIESSTGKKITLENTIFILTSNIGFNSVEQRDQKYETYKKDKIQYKEQCLKDVHQLFSDWGHPELERRISTIIPYNFIDVNNKIVKSFLFNMISLIKDGIAEREDIPNKYLEALHIINENFEFEDVKDDIIKIAHSQGGSGINQVLSNYIKGELIKWIKNL